MRAVGALRAVVCAVAAWLGWLGCLASLALLFGAAPVQAQTSGTPPESATLLGTALTLTFDKGGAGIVIGGTPPLVHGFTVDGLGSGSMHPSAVAHGQPDGHTRARQGRGTGADGHGELRPGHGPQDPDENGREWDNRLRYTDNTLVEAFSGVPVTILAPKPATGVSVSFVSGRTVNLSWTLPAQPAGVRVTAVEVHSTQTAPGVTTGSDFSAYGLSRLAADTTSQERPVIHGGFTFYYRVRLVTNVGDVDSQVVSWTSDQDNQRSPTGLTASNATQTTVDLAWTVPQQPAWVAQMGADEIWIAVQRQEADETWSTVAKLAANAVAHTVTGLSGGTAYSFRVALDDPVVIAPSTPVSVTTLVGPLTASFHDVPAEHDGESEFSFELRFSEDLAPMSSATLRDQALAATNATVTRAKRVVEGENRLWTITVRPNSAEAVTVSLRATTDCAAEGALCTPDGRPLSNATTATVAAHQWAGTPLKSARLLGTKLTLTFGKPVVIGGTDLLVHGFTVDGLSNSGSVHPSAMTMDNRTATLELGTAAEPGQTVTVSYDPDMVPKTRDENGREWDNRLRYTDGTLAAAFSGVPVAVGPEPATGLSVSFESGKTAKVSWTLPAQPADVSVTAVELWWGRTEPGVTEVPDLRRYNRLGEDWTSQPWDVRHGGYTDYFRVRLVTNFGDVDSQVVSWTSDQEGVQPATGLTASNATQTTVDLAWTLPAEQPEWVTQVAGEFWSEVQQYEADGNWWSTVAKLAGDAVAHPVTGLSAGTAYSFRIRLGFNTGPAYSEPVSVTTLAATGLTASFHDVPASHDGETEFSFELQFSEDMEGAPHLRRSMFKDGAIETSGELINVARASRGQSQHWTITVRPLSDEPVSVTLAATGDCAAAGAICTADGQKLSSPVTALVEGPTAQLAATGLTASFHDVPASHDGETEFSFELRFSEDMEGAPHLRRSMFNDGAIETSGELINVARAPRGQSQHWTITVRPLSDEPVSVTLAATGDCAAAGAICTADGQKLSSPVTALVEGPTAQPLTASFEDVPAEHDGGVFTFRLQFSEGADVKPRTLRDRSGDSAFDVDGGHVDKAPRVDFRNDLWEIHVKPSGAGPVTITLPATTSCAAAGAVCTSDGRPLSNTSSATVAGPVGVSVADARVEEGAGAVLAFAVTLSRAATSAFTVDYATSDGSARAGEDYTAASGTLSFQAGVSSRTIEVAVLDDAHDEGEETLTLRLSNASGGQVTDGEATGTIENADLMPAALLARIGRATAEQVVEHIEERMAAPRQRGFRARFAGRELQPGSERDFALGFLSSFAPMGTGMAGAVPMGGAAPVAMGSHPAGPAAFGAGSAGMRGAMGMGGAMGMAGVGGTAGAMGTGLAGVASMGGASAMAGYGPADGMHGGGLFGSMGMGGGVFSDSELELNRESHGGVLSVWSRSSRSYFSGMEDALSLDGDVRTTMVGADYSRGALTVGLSVGRTLGLGGYSGPSGGRMSTSMTGFYPWAGYQFNDRVSVWGVTGYGSGSLNLTPDGASALETGVSMAMSAVGTRGELIGSRATGGFALAFKADAMWVGAASDLLDGAAGRLNASEAGVTRVRTALEGSRGFTLGGRLSLRPSVEVGLRRDGGDAETGAGMDVGGGLVFTDTVTGLSLDMRVRTLVVHQAEGFRERGMSLSFGWDPTPSSPLGLTAKVAPSWGGQARGGAEALWGNQMAYGMGSHQMYGAGDRVDAEVGYGLPVGTRFVGTPRVGLATSPYGRDYRLGYGLGVLEQRSLNFELGVDAQRRESPIEGGTSNGFLGRATVAW